MLAAVCSALAVPASAQHHGEGPASLFLFYNCKPEKRAEFRAHMEGAGVAQFENWKKQGVFKDYLMLFSSFVNPSWDMLVRLDFEKYVDSDKWKTVERTAPSGLSPEGLAICTPTDSDLADLMWTKSQPSRNPGKAVYVVMPFAWEHSKNLYFSYFPARPKYDLDAWVDEGSLSWYGAFVNQHYTGARWHVLWLLEYADSRALSRREVLKQSWRKEKLARDDDPAFRFVRQTGNESRAIAPNVVADVILPPAARAASASTLAKIRQRGRLIVGTEPKFKLFNARNPATGEYDGFLVDISKALARALLGDEGRLEIRAVSNDDRLPSVETGAVDMIIDTTGPVSTNPTGPNANKTERVDFSEEVYNSGSALLVRKGSSIKSLDDITGATRVLYVKANPDTKFIRAKAPAASYVGFDDTGEAFKALKAGRGDVLAQVDTRLYELASRDPDYAVVGKFTNRPDCIMIQKGDHELREYLNGFIQSLKAGGEYNRLYRKWFKIAESEWRVP